jgi:cardiolipin synthase
MWGEKSMKVVGYVVLFIIIWCTCDFILGRKKHLRLSKIRETPIVHGNLDIFPHGKKLFADYFAELKNAARHIHILFYIVKNDRFSQEFLQILKDKAREGVEVRLLIDRLGSLKVSKQMVMELREAGVHFAYSNSIRLPFLFYSSQVRNHRKVSIIDGKIGYLGGFNVAKEYIDEDPKLSPWRDYHLKITGAGVPSLQKEFLIDWKEYGRENLLEDFKYFPESHDGSIRHQFIPTEAHGLEEKYIKLIQSAEDAIIIGTPYFIPSKKMVTELLKAEHRGVKITIIVPYTADHILVQEASFRYLRPLLKQGVQVFQFNNGFYHAKTIVIDDKVCDIGSANFDKRSLYLNKEINCYIYDREFISRVKNVMNWDIQNSRPLTLADLNTPNLYRSIKEVIAGAVSYFL